MHALRCPNGTDPNSALYDLCHGNGVADVTFSATGPNGFSAQAVSTVPVAPGPGIATFGELEGGSYTITQEAVDPSTELVVYCSLADADVVVPFSYVDADTISLDLPVDTGVVCDWYALPPADASTTLQVTSYRCVFNMVANVDTPLDVFREDCQPSEGTTQFTLTPDGAAKRHPDDRIGWCRNGSLRIAANAIPIRCSPASLEISTTRMSSVGSRARVLPFSGQQGLSIAIDASQGPYVCEWFNVAQNASGYRTR